jgi:hypothetical protein
MTVPVADFENLATEEIKVSNTDFSLYPNPTTNLVNINLANNTDVATITISNILGETVKTNTMTGVNSQLSLESLINCVYFITLETTNNRITKSIVKN